MRIYPRRPARPAADGGILDAAASNIHSIEKLRDGRLARREHPSASVRDGFEAARVRKKSKRKGKVDGKTSAVKKKSDCGSFNQVFIGPRSDGSPV